MQKYPLIGTILLVLILSIYSNTANATHAFNNLITFNDSSFNNTVIGSSTSTKTFKARSFGGDASPSLWINSTAFDSIKSTVTTNPFGELDILVDGDRIKSLAFGLHKNLDDADFPFYRDKTDASQFVQTDGWYDSADRLNNCQTGSFKPLKVTTNTASRVKINNPSVITSFNGTFNVAIEHRIDVLDGLSLVESKLIGTANHNFSNSNKAKTLELGFSSTTVTFANITSSYFHLNFVQYENIKITTSGDFQISFTSDPRLDMDVFYDDIQLLDSWTVGHTFDIDKFGTCSAPSEDGKKFKLILVTKRAIWNFDDADIGTSKNPNGYEGWSFINGNVTTPTEKWLVTRSTSTSTSGLKSIELKWTGNNTDVGTSNCNRGSNDFLVPRTHEIELFNPKTSPLENTNFILDFKIESMQTGSNQCIFRVDFIVDTLESNGILISSKTISSPTLELLGVNDSNNTSWIIDNIYDMGNSTQQFNLLKLRVKPTLVNLGGSVTAQGVTTIEIRLDTYGSNWLVTFLNKPSTTPTIDVLCESFPTEPICKETSDALEDVGGTGGTPQQKLGNVPLFANGTINWTALNLTSTASAGASASTLVNNIALLIGGAPTLVIPLAVLLIGGLGIAGTMKENAGIPIMAFFIIWAFMFAIFGFFPMWIALIVGLGVGALIVIMARKGVSGE